MFDKYINTMDMSPNSELALLGHLLSICSDMATKMHFLTFFYRKVS